MKFLKEDRFWATVNQWIRDGSNLYSVVDTSDGITAALKGKDGCTEELILFYEMYDYYQSDLIEGD